MPSQKVSVPEKMIEVPLTQLPHAAGLNLPSYATPGSCGMDLVAALDQDRVLAPRERTLVPTGIALALPAGYEGQIRSRSGLALKHGLCVLNSPGTIDQDYRGEVGVILLNTGDEPFVIKRGMRIAQLVVAPMVRAVLVPQGTLEDSKERKTGGFGSTGL